MRRGLWVPLAFALCLTGAAVPALLHRTALAFTLGVRSTGVSAVLKPRDIVCQRPIYVPAHGAFDRVSLQLGTYARPGPALAVTVRDASGGVLGRSRLAGGYPDITARPREVIRVGHIRAGTTIETCVRNLGSRKVALYGAGDAAVRTSSAYEDGRPLGADVDMVFERSPRTIASLVPAIAERAALFRPGFVGAWTYILLAALLVVAAPLLLLRAWRLAVRASIDAEG